VIIDYWIYLNEPEGKGQVCRLVGKDDKKAKKVRFRRNAFRYTSMGLNPGEDEFP